MLRFSDPTHPSQTAITWDESQSVVERWKKYAGQWKDGMQNEVGARVFIDAGVSM